MKITLGLLIIFLTQIVSSVLIIIFRNYKYTSCVISISVSLSILVLFSAIILLWTGIPLNLSAVWMILGSLFIEMGLYFDQQSALFLLITLFISMLIHCFSLGFFSFKNKCNNFFSGLMFFTFSITGIIISNNLLMLFIFWELVGFSSYLLIGYYFQKNSSTKASRKSFVVNRIGDMGFIVGIIFAYWHLGTISLKEMQSVILQNPSMLRNAIAALLTCGFISKSAQFPLHVWLPDAMSGPAPASALIHAATMVAGGIYLLCRIDCIVTTDVRILIVIISILMTIYASIHAIFQNHVKSVLAYSTLSQLAYMSMAYGIGYSGLALLHLTIHAFFKSLLFLSIGAICKKNNYSHNIDNVNNLWIKIPLISIVFTSGILELCGIHILSGVHSKDIITKSIYFDHLFGYFALNVSTILTILYAIRLNWMVFFKDTNFHYVLIKKINRTVMTIPLLVLSIIVISNGLFKYWPQILISNSVMELCYVQYKIDYNCSIYKFWYIFVLVHIASIFLFILTLYCGYINRLSRYSLSLIYQFRCLKVGFNEIYSFYVHNIQQQISYIFYFLDNFLISGIVIRGVFGIVGFFGILMKIIHASNLRVYIYWLICSWVLLIIYIILLNKVQINNFQ